MRDSRESCSPVRRPWVRPRPVRTSWLDSSSSTSTSAVREPVGAARRMRIALVSSPSRFGAHGTWRSALDGGRTGRFTPSRGRSGGPGARTSRITPNRGPSGPRESGSILRGPRRSERAAGSGSSPPSVPHGRTPAVAACGVGGGAARTKARVRASSPNGRGPRPASSGA